LRVAAAEGAIKASTPCKSFRSAAATAASSTSRIRFVSVTVCFSIQTIAPTTTATTAMA
jgi:hypothetical protein